MVTNKRGAHTIFSLSNASPQASFSTVPAGSYHKVMRSCIQFSERLTETISTLAHLSRFIIADLTEAKSVPQELERIVPRLHVPVQPLLHASEEDAYALFRDFSLYPWVLPLHRYSDESALLQSLDKTVIDPAEQMAREMEKRRATLYIHPIN